MPQRRSQPGREPVAEPDDDRQSKAAPQTQMAWQWIEAKRDSKRRHDQARKRHRIFEIAIDEIPARIEPLLFQIMDIAVERPDAELLGLQPQQSQISRGDVDEESGRLR